MVSNNRVIFKNLYGSRLQYTICFGIVLWTWPFLLGKYVDTSFSYMQQNDIESALVQTTHWNGVGVNLCNTTTPVTELHNIEHLTDKAFADQLLIEPGGHQYPRFCFPKYKVAVIIPYRNRSQHLDHFLKYMHHFLTQQNIDYRFFVIEQLGREAFNRGKLLNIGFIEANNVDNSTKCFIFHDVDLLPTNVLNTYACTHMPRHMYSSVNTFRFTLPYRSMSGGAVALLSNHFEQVNGFSNAFNGWGGEDDDFYRRIRANGLRFARFDPSVATYMMMPHKQAHKSSVRFHILAKHQPSNGLDNLIYNKLIDIRPLHTHIYVSL